MDPFESTTALFDQLWGAQPGKTFDILVVVTGSTHNKDTDTGVWLFSAFRAQVTLAPKTPASDQAAFVGSFSFRPPTDYRYFRFCSTPNPDPKLVGLLSSGLFLLRRPVIAPIGEETRPKIWIKIDDSGGRPSEDCTILEYSPQLDPLIADIETIRQERIRQIQIAEEHHRLRREPISAEIRALEAQRLAKIEESNFLERVRNDTRFTIDTAATMQVFSKIQFATNNQ